MTKNIKVPIIMASSVITHLSKEDPRDTVQTMYLLDDVLKTKGHPRSVMENETAYTERERLDLIIKLMDINMSQRFYKGKRSYVGLFYEKQKEANRDYKVEASAWHELRKKRFKDEKELK